MLKKRYGDLGSEDPDPNWWKWTILMVTWLEVLLSWCCQAQMRSVLLSELKKKILSLQPSKYPELHSVVNKTVVILLLKLLLLQLRERKPPDNWT